MTGQPFKAAARNWRQNTRKALPEPGTVVHTVTPTLWKLTSLSPTRATQGLSETLPSKATTKHRAPWGKDRPQAGSGFYTLLLLFRVGRTLTGICSLAEERLRG